MKLKDYEAIPAEFSNEDWERILYAIQHYVITQENYLSGKNVGDKEWQELRVFDSIAKDIEYFIITKKHV